MFSAAAYASATPHCSVVESMSCVRPTAPACEIALGLNADSPRITALIRAGSSRYRFAATRIMSSKSPERPIGRVPLKPSPDDPWNSLIAGHDPKTALAAAIGQMRGAVPTVQKKEIGP